MSTILTVDDVIKSMQNFGWSDYAVFGTMLASCIAIGLHFGQKDRSKTKSGKGTATEDSEALDYLVGGRKMKVFPVSISLIASLLSGIGLLGQSTEIYVYGGHYAFLLLAFPMVGVTMHIFLVPV